MNDLSPSPSLDTSKIDSILGISSSSSDILETGSFDPKEKAALGAIIQSGEPGGIDTASNKDTGSLIPDYLKPYEDLLAKKPEARAVDETDYLSKALSEFGSEYRHINNKDSYEDEIFLRSNSENLLNNYAPYKKLLDITEGKIERTAVLRDEIKALMQNEANKNFKIFNEDEYEERIASFFDESGKLNAQGDAIANRILSEKNNALSAVRQEARILSQSQLEKVKSNRSALSEYVKTPKIDNIDLDPELGEYIQDYVNSGKTREWLTKDLSPKENAERETLIAIISDPYLRAQFIKVVDGRGQNYGINEIAKRKFNQ